MWLKLFRYLFLPEPPAAPPIQDTIEALSDIQLPGAPLVPGTEKLIVIDVDFQLYDKPEKLAAMEAALRPIHEKYGLDFFILEPGMKLRRFDDI